MSRKYKFHNPEGTYFITFAVQEWADVFSRNVYRDLLIESLDYCIKHKGLELFAWCIMTNHVHLMARATSGFTLSEILRDLKKYTSKAIVRAISENYRESRRKWLLAIFRSDEGIRFWRGDNHPIEVYSNKIIRQKLNYIHNNPVKAGLVFRPEHYPYSSAVDYAGEKGLLEVTIIE